MDMSADELYVAALGQATAVVKQVRVDQMGLPTPDTEWSVRDLVGHMLYELSWVPEIVHGKTIEDVGDKYDGDLFADGTDLAVAWEKAAVLAERAVEQADEEATAHLSYGDTTVDKYLREAATDQLIHAWDLGQAIGINVRFEPAVAQAVYDRIKDQDLSSSGLFASPVTVPVDADVQTKLLAHAGRSADWKRSI